MEYKITHTPAGTVRVRESGFRRIQRVTVGLGASAVALTGALSVGLAAPHVNAPVTPSTVTATTPSAGLPGQNTPTQASPAPAAAGAAPVAVSGAS